MKIIDDPTLLQGTCAARGCPCAIPKKRLMCGYHWRLVPEMLRSAIWRTYVPGQEDAPDLRVPEYARAVVDAIRAVAKIEGREIPE